MGVDFKWNYLEKSFESCMLSNFWLQHLKDIFKVDYSRQFASSQVITVPFYYDCKK